MPAFKAPYTTEAKAMRESARTAGHTRLLAYASGLEPYPISWKSFENDAAMDTFIRSWDAAESISINCAIQVAVVNPQDSEETICHILERQQVRSNGGLGYFSEAF